MPATQPNVNPTPRQRFQSVKGCIEAHRSLLEIPAFDRALDHACLEYQTRLGNEATDPNRAMAVGFKMAGMFEFLTILKTLAEAAPTAPPKPPSDNLPPLGNLKRQ